MMSVMNIQGTIETGGRIPSLTLGRRLKLALDSSDVSAQDMAEALEVSRQTVSRWMKDRGARPRRVYVAHWALLTGVDPDWLETGRDRHRDAS